MWTIAPAVAVADKQLWRSSASSRQKTSDISIANCSPLCCDGVFFVQVS